MSRSNRHLSDDELLNLTRRLDADHGGPSPDSDQAILHHAHTSVRSESDRLADYRSPWWSMPLSAAAALVICVGIYAAMADWIRTPGRSGEHIVSLESQSLDESLVAAPAPAPTSAQRLPGENIIGFEDGFELDLESEQLLASHDEGQGPMLPTRLPENMLPERVMNDRSTARQQLDNERLRSQLRDPMAFRETGRANSAAGSAVSEDSTLAEQERRSGVGTGGLTTSSAAAVRREPPALVALRESHKLGDADAFLMRLKELRRGSVALALPADMACWALEQELSEQLVLGSNSAPDCPQQ